MNSENLILYRGMEHGEILNAMERLMEAGRSGGQAQPGLLAECAGRLLAFASDYGFEGNLWHCYLAFLLANHENAFSTACEVVGSVDSSINAFAIHDLEIFKELFDWDWQTIGDEDIYALLCDYRGPGAKSKVYNERIRDRISELAKALRAAKDAQGCFDSVIQFYKDCGVGKFGLHKAFRVAEDDNQVRVEPITNVEQVYLDELVGYELQKAKLVENTEAFVEGRAANNVLLYGDAGTGKSSSIKAILNQYYGRGLRIIEVYKHQFRDLAEIIDQIKNRNYKFIIYMDDLSFEDHELEYKYLKAIIEGGLGKKPGNVLIYATSNRRHLIREKFSDKRESQDDLHGNDTVQEKLSLVARFGVTIYFGAPSKKEFENIVRILAEKHQVFMPEDELYLEANKWEMSHGGLSGRTAAQFITYLLGKGTDSEE